MAREIGMTFTLNGNLGTGFRSAFRGAKGLIEGITEDIRRMERSPEGKLGASMMRQRAQIKEYSASLRVATGQLNDLRVRATAAGGATGILKRQIELAENTVNRLSGQLRRANDGYRTTIAEARNAAGSVRGLSNAYSELSASMGKAHARRAKLVGMQTRSDELRSQRSDLQGRLMSTAGQAMSVALPIKSAVEFESAMADAAKTIDGMRDDSGKLTGKYYEMEGAIKSLSGSLPLAHEELAALFAAGGQQGMTDVKELNDFATMAAHMSVAFGMSTEEATNSIGGFRSALHMTLPETRKVLDLMNQFANTSSAAEKDIADVVRRIGPLGNVGGVAAKPMTALAATLTSMKVAPEIAATGIKNLILAMTAGTSATKSQDAALRKLGIDAVGLARNMQEDGPRAITAVLEAIKKLPKAEQLSVLQKLFGRESMGAIAPLLDSLDLVKQNLELAGDESRYAGAMQAEFANRSKTTANALMLARNSARNLGITVGNALLPAVNKGIEVFRGIIDGVTEFASKHETLTAVIAGGAAALATFAVGGLAFGLLVNGMATSVLGLRRAYLAVADAPGKLADISVRAFTQMKSGLASLRRSFSLTAASARIMSIGIKGALIGTGIGALVVGLGMAAEYVITHWEEISPVISGVCDTIKNAVGPVIDWVTDVFAGVVTFFTSVGPAIASRIGPSIERISNAFATIWNGIRAYAGFIIGVWRKAFGFVADIFSGIGSFAVSVWEGIAAAADAAVELVQSIWSGITGFFGDLWDGVCNLASGAWEWITSAGSTCLEGLTMSWGWLTDFFGGLWEGICTTVSSAWDWIATSCEPVATFVTGIWEGVSSFLSGVWDGVVAAAQACWEGISAVWTPVTDFFSGIADGIRSVFAGLFEWLADKFKWVTDVIGSIKSAVGSIFGAASDIAEGAKGVGTAIGEGISDAYNKSGTVMQARALGRSEAKERASTAAARRANSAAFEQMNKPKQPAAATPPAPKVTDDEFMRRMAATPGSAPEKKGRGGGGSRRGSGASSRSTGTGTTIVRLAGDNRNFTTQYIPAGAARTSGAPLPVSGVSSSSASGGRQSVSGTGRSTASGASASPTRTTMPTVSNATAIVAAKPLPVIVQNFPGQKKGVTLEPEKSAPLPVALPQQPIQLSTPASAIPTGTPSPLASTTPSASVPAPATGLRARTAPVMGGLLEGLRGRMSGMLSTTGAALRDLPEAATRLVGDLSSDVTSVLPFMGKHGPYLPGNINLPDRGRSESGAPVDGGNGTVQVSLHQTFNVGGGNADAIQRRLTALGPEFERMVRRALSDISAQDRRVAYAQ